MSARKGGAVTRATDPDGSRRYYWSRLGKVCSVWVPAGVTSVGSLPLRATAEEAEQDGVRA